MNKANKHTVEDWNGTAGHCIYDVLIVGFTY